MSYLRKLWRGEPTAMRTFHGWAAVFWATSSLPICAYFAKDPFQFFMSFVSIYAVACAHWAAWQSSRVEQHADPDSPNP